MNDERGNICNNTVIIPQIITPLEMSFCIIKNLIHKTTTKLTEKKRKIISGGHGRRGIVAVFVDVVIFRCAVINIVA
jgi:hypothetical protein